MHVKTSGIKGLNCSKMPLIQSNTVRRFQDHFYYLFILDVILALFLEEDLAISPKILFQLLFYSWFECCFDHLIYLRSNQFYQ